MYSNEIQSIRNANNKGSLTILLLLFADKNSI